MSLQKNNKNSNQLNQEMENTEYRIYDKAKNNSRITISYLYIPSKDLLGKGGFAEVYKVKREKNTNEEPTYFALKKINKSVLQDKDRKQKILTEIKIHRTLNHKNICKFEHSFEDDNFVYILVEYCPFKSLNDLLKKRIKLKEYEVRFYMFQVLEALMYLKRKKIVHRDLTLGNIFLKDYQTIKLGDFGLSFKENENDEKKETFCGTEGYFAPETVYYKFSNKSDIFAFGVCIYICLTGKSLFSNAINTEDVISKKEIPYDLFTLCSEQCKDLLNQIFTMENFRIDLDDIYSHPFFNKGIGIIGEKLPIFPFHEDYSKEEYVFVRKKYEDEIEVLNKKVIMSNVNPFKKKNNNFDDYMKIDSNSHLKSINIKPKKKRFTGKNINLESSKVYLRRNYREVTFDMTKRKKKQILNSSKKLSSDLSDLKNLSTFNLNNSNINNSSALININLNSSTLNNSNNMSSNINFNKSISNLKNLSDGNQKDKEIKLNHNQSDGNNFENLLEKEIIKKSNYSIIEDNIIQYIDLGNKYGLGYKLNGGDIGILFCDGTGMIKLKNCLLYIYKELNNKKKEIIQEIIYPPNKQCSNEILKKIHILEFLILEFDKKKMKLNKKFNRYNYDEFVYLKKWKKTSKGYFFILSNNNIQIIFEDKVQIIFFCNYQHKKIEYIDEKGEIFEFISRGENFYDIKCSNNKIRNRINYAISEIVK